MCTCARASALRGTSSVRARGPVFETGADTVARVCMPISCAGLALAQHAACRMRKQWRHCPLVCSCCHLWVAATHPACRVVHLTSPVCANRSPRCPRGHARAREAEPARSHAQRARRRPQTRAGGRGSRCAPAATVRGLPAGPHASAHTRATTHHANYRRGARTHGHTRCTCVGGYTHSPERRPHADTSVPTAYAHISARAPSKGTITLHCVVAQQL